ncbi:MAG TPA: response regulator transcription factor [Solimonas sp.]|nr:response regulator transcription factor [Solimonas sp.]
MLKILLVDDHELFREGIKLLLANLSDEVSFAEASSCDKALALPADERVDVVLLDFHLPGMHGFEALRALRERYEEAVIVVLSAEENPARIVQAIDEGAAGFIPKSSTHAVMMAALRLVLAGGTYLPPHALCGVPGSASMPAATPASGNALSGLTQRQIETLRLAMQGKANKVIAREMDLSEATVKAHLSASFRALGVRNRTEAVFAAARIGLPV